MAAITVEITDGTTTFDLIYDPASQANYSARKNMRVVMEDTDVLQHIPDDGPPVMVRAKDRDRTVFLTKDVLGDTQDEVLDYIVRLKRFIDGSDQQAADHNLSGNQNRVDLKIKLEDATKTTINPIKWGNVDDSGAHYNAAATKSKYAIGILVTLHLTIRGQGESFTLRNDLASSPHFIESTSGVAHGWTVLGSPITTSINTVAYLIGGRSQFFRVNSTATNEGFDSDVVIASIGTDGVAYAWVRADSVNNDPIVIRLADGSFNIIETKIFDPGNISGYDYAVIGANGKTWYRYSVSGQNTVAANFRLRVFRTSAAGATEGGYFIDGAYLQTNTTVLPTGLSWCSANAIENRYDPSAGNKSRINYLDVWGLPGDSDAAITLKVEPLTSRTDQTGWVIAKSTDGKYPAANLGCVYSATNAVWTYTPGFMSTADTDALNGTARQNNSGIGATATFSLTGTDAQLFLSKPRRIFVLGETDTSSSASTIDMIAYIEVVGLDRFNYETTAQASFVNNGEYEWIDLGLINATGVVPDNVPSISDVNITIEIDYNRSGSEVLKFSGIYAMPLDLQDGLAVLELVVPTEPFWLGNGDGSLIDGALGITRPYTGRIESVASGNKMSRFYFSSYDKDIDDLHHNITATLSVSAEITPRTRHLLGTV